MTARTQHALEIATATTSKSYINLNAIRGLEIYMPEKMICSKVLKRPFEAASAKALSSSAENTIRTALIKLFKKGITSIRPVR